VFQEHIVHGSKNLSHLSLSASGLLPDPDVSIIAASNTVSGHAGPQANSPLVCQDADA
jgi:hypothetical protein